MSSLNHRLNRGNFNKYKKGDWDVHIFESCTSTFDEAKNLISEDTANGTMVISEIQTSGRGRQRRQWVSPEGGLWMSVIFRPKLNAAELAPVTILCAVAAAKAIEELYPNIEPQIKWPNDIYIKGKKVCGILAETVVKNSGIEYFIAGIGINANNAVKSTEEIKNISTSLKENGAQVIIEQLASLINDNLIGLIKEYEACRSLEFILDYYTKKMLWINEEAELKNTITGKVSKSGTTKGIGEKGELLLETESGTEKIVSGELSLRRKL